MLLIYIFIIIILVFGFKMRLFKMAKRLEYYYKFSLIYIGISLISVKLIPLFLWNGRNVKNAIIMAKAVRRLTKLLGVTWHLRNAEILAEDRGAVVIFNHQSSLDLISSSYLWKAWKNAVPVAKKEILFSGPLGLCMYLIDTIFVDRRNPTHAHKALETKSDILLKKNVKILVCPEGTRNSDHTKLLPFKKGAFNIAVRAQVPIIPIVVSRYYFINGNISIFNKGHVIAQCLEPVSTEGLTMEDIPELIDKVRKNMEKVFKELSAEVTKSLPSDYPLAK